MEEFKELQKQNDILRDSLEDCLRLLPTEDYKQAWEIVGKIIENELKQEKHCNQ